ncbi:MAG TPA: hypothetical protein VGR43_08390 [Dehalococcoidia bacterium]|nr:hypothetical protein [Dehalococcoidia bacterium]
MVGWGYCQHVDYHAAPASELKLLDERFDLRDEVGDMRGEQNVAIDAFGLHPAALDRARVRYSRLLGGGAEFGHHPGGGLDVDHFPAAARHRQGIAPSAAADIDEDVLLMEERSQPP